MNYLTLLEVPEVIREFYHEVTKSEATGNTVAEAYTYFDENGEQTAFTQVPEYADVTYVELLSRPETKTQADLERVIALGKPSKVISKFAELVAYAEQWEWFAKYNQYLDDLAVWEAAVEEFVPIQLEDETFTEFMTPAPTEPSRPSVRTGEEVYAPYKRTQLKRERADAIDNITVDVDGLVYDGDETSQTRMLKAITILVGDQEMPWTLANNDIVLVTQTELKKALTLAGTAQSELWQII